MHDYYYLYGIDIKYALFTYISIIKIFFIFIGVHVHNDMLVLQSNLREPQPNWDGYEYCC